METGKLCDNIRVTKNGLVSGVVGYINYTYKQVENRPTSIIQNAFMLKKEP